MKDDDKSLGDWFNENGVDDYDLDGKVGFFDKVMDKKIYQSIMHMGDPVGDVDEDDEDDDF